MPQILYCIEECSGEKQANDENFNEIHKSWCNGGKRNTLKQTAYEGLLLSFTLVTIFFFFF